MFSISVLVLVFPWLIHVRGGHNGQSDRGSLWSHGCRGISGLEQSTNTLRCPVGCSISIHQVTYARKNRPGCPHEISYPVEPHCCRREASDDCFQNKAQKIPVLQLLCREAANVCELNVDRVALRCPRNAFSISTLRSIRYGCVCATTPPTTTFTPVPASTLITSKVTSLATTSLPEQILNVSTNRDVSTPPEWLTSEILRTFPRSSSTQMISPLYSKTSPSSSLNTRYSGTTTVYTQSLKSLSTGQSSTSLPKARTTTATTPWTLTAGNTATPEQTSVGSGTSKDLPTQDESRSSDIGINVTFLGGIIGGGILVLASVLTTVLICLKRRRGKSEAQGTEEASQYAYEIMDISLRRPQPIVTQAAEATSRHSEDANDINLDNQSDQGTFLEKQIQRYLITSIYAEIKDIKRLSQESNGSAKPSFNEKTATVKPTPKPRKISDLYAKVNKHSHQLTPEDNKEKTNLTQLRSDNKAVDVRKCVGVGTDCEGTRQNGIKRHSVCSATRNSILSQTDTVKGYSPEFYRDTYDRLISCDTKNTQNERTTDRIGSGPYDELYSTHEGMRTSDIRYFTNCEYSTLNVQQGRVSLVSNNSESRQVYS